MVPSLIARTVRLATHLRQIFHERVAFGVGPTTGTTKDPHLWFGGAGLVSIVGRIWCAHLFVRPEHWIWGHEVESYDMVCDYYGAGPLALLVRVNNVPPVPRAECRCDRGVVTNGIGWDLCAGCWKVLDMHGRHEDMAEAYVGADIS